MTKKEKAYEKLLNRVADICATNQHVEFGLEEANEEFEAISNQIAVGIQEIIQAKAEQEYWQDENQLVEETNTG